MSVSYKDYYKILEVERTATTEEIDKSYKKLARKYHPDLNQGDSKAEEKFKEVNEAHEVLKDPQKRKLYDQLGPNWKDGQNFQGAPGFENFQFNFKAVLAAEISVISLKCSSVSTAALAAALSITAVLAVTNVSVKDMMWKQPCKSVWRKPIKAERSILH